MAPSNSAFLNHTIQKMPAIAIQSEHNLPDLPRRRSLAFLAGSLLLCAMPLRSWAADSQQRIQSFVVFMRLSRILTGTDDLDADFAQRIYNLIAAEPWGIEHIAQVAEKLKVASASGVITPLEQEELLAPDHFSAGERWFINHLLTTWLSGIYYHQIGDQVVTYQHALMNTALIGVRAPYGQCGGTFGYWSDAPTGVRK